TTRRTLLGAVLAGAAWLGSLALPVAAQAQQGGSGPLKIGVLNDMSGIVVDLSGPGSVMAARMAIEDFGGKVLGRPVELLEADHLN
ncbi:ABC transporter substrate-binding protein, partial [Klebsiella pneumoniae]|nr:ABC transporter substrate-binding protein [Klebsiella pneumoniae]